MEVPIYSHLKYDILPNEVQTICNPDILIVEGVNVLQVDKENQVFVSDFFDFSLYVDADVNDIERWYVERFLLLQKTAFQSPESYFHRYIDFSKEQAIKKRLKFGKKLI